MQHAEIRGELDAAIAAVLDRGDFILGQDVERFERSFAEYVGVEHAVGVASGTAALALGLRAAGVGPGDEVIVPAHTYIASALGVIHAGATPVPCDVVDATGLIDLDAAAAAVGERTAAVMAVHLYGQACDLDACAELAAGHGLLLVEDAAQAHGARWDAASAGSAGRFSAFSFYPSKNLGALGDAGMICTDDADLAELARSLRHIGQRGHGDHVVPGFNERLGTIQAAALRVKLPHLDGWNDSRRRAAARYRELLPEELFTLAPRPEAEDVFHVFPIRCADRDRSARALSAAGIQTGVHYSLPLHRHPAMSDLRGEFPVAEAWAREELSLPMFPGISDRQVESVAAALRALPADVLGRR